MPEFQPESPQPGPPAKPPKRDTTCPGMGESNEIDPTPGWIPFVVILCFAVVLVFVFALASFILP